MVGEFVGASKNSPYLTPWLSLEQFTGFFKEILEFYPLGTFGPNWWVLFESTHTLPTGCGGSELVGTFKKYPECACWVSDPLPPV